MKKRRSLSSILLFFILYSCLSIGTPVYLECEEDLYPDEWLELFGLPRQPIDFKTVLTAVSTTLSFRKSIPDDWPSSCRDSEGLCLRPLPLETILSVALRC